MWIRLGAVLVLPLVLAGCGDRASGAASGRTVPDLDGTSWVATSIVEHGQPREIAPGTEIRVDFADGHVSISGGCNGMSSSYHLTEESELRTGALAGTLMACEQPRMDQDSWLSGTAFASPLVASVEGDTLTLERDGLEMTLQDRSVVSPDASLVDTHWQLDGIRTADAVSSVPTGVTSTLLVGAGGAVTVDAGCNTGHGSATVTDTTITFGPLATTRKACADHAAQQTENAVLAVLDGEVAWSITEQRLTLTKGDQGLVYRAAP
jgi:heat shock protein HslJ